jgi:hypothetical protein
MVRAAGCPPVLGPDGLHLFLRVCGFRRNEHRVQVPGFLSRCVINAITHTAFPVLEPADANMILLYHAFGFPQRRGRDSSPMIEDIAHAFFGDATTGERPWLGQAAVFSLAKFFPMAGLAGGLVLRDEETAEAIRALANTAPPEPPGVRTWMRTVMASGYTEGASHGERLFIEGAYELLYQFVRPDPADLAGFPNSLDGIRKVAALRAERVSYYHEFFRGSACPSEFWESREQLLPFVLPYFGSGDPERLRRVDRALAEQGVSAGLYHVDLNRGAQRPNYRECLLLPCHHAISVEDFATLCQTVRANDR